MEVGIKELIVKVDLDSKVITEALKEAPIYKRSGIVAATRITKKGLREGAYMSKDVWYDPELDTYSLSTYEMEEDEEGIRTPVLKETRNVVPGDWIVTLPMERTADKAYNYVVSSAVFWRMFEATDEKGFFETRGRARIIPNIIGRKIEAFIPSLGFAQTGDTNCFICAPYNPKKSDQLAVGRRYIISETDFEMYWEPAFNPK